MGCWVLILISIFLHIRKNESSHTPDFQNDKPNWEHVFFTKAFFESLYFLNQDNNTPPMGGDTGPKFNLLC